MRFSCKICLILLLLMPMLAGAVSGVSHLFTVRGIGGAGGLFVPSISPYNPKLMFVASDMGGTYRSTDGGQSWELIPFQQIGDNAGSAYPAFFKDKIFWNSANTLRVSRDEGKTWQEVPRNPWHDNITIKHLTALPGSPDVLLVSATNGLWRSVNDGADWVQITPDWTVEPVALGGKVYTFSGRNTFRVSLDRGLSWSAHSFPWMQDNTVFSLTGGIDGQEPVLFAAVWNIGIIRSRDGGNSWQVVVDKFEDQNNLQMAANQTKVVYAFQNHGKGWCQTAWCSADGGDSWQKAFRLSRWLGNVEPSWVQTELKWGYFITKNGFFASRTDPDLVLLATQGDLYITRDGANSWQPIINCPVGTPLKLSYQSTGLEVTSCWKYLIDPFDRNRHFIAYSDIGLARSDDGGKSWRHSAKGSPWANTFYDVVFDPQQPGRVYAAASSRHDIPHWTHVDAGSEQTNRGGVVVSDDGGDNWRRLGSGIPDKPATSLLLIPGGTPDRNTLFVTLYDEGVFKSVDGGLTWRKSANGPGHPGNLHALRIRRHPQSGNLYCLVTAFRTDKEFPVPGGLWKSVDNGESWFDITASEPFFWPTDFALDPANEQLLWLSAATPPGKPQGGIWHTRDGGKNWLRLLDDAELKKTAGGAGYDHLMTVALDPADPHILYAGTTSHGLWFSTDEGKQWLHYAEFPHRSVQSINFNPYDAKELLMTTFGGGAWSGPRITRP